MLFADIITILPLLVSLCIGFSANKSNANERRRRGDAFVNKIVEDLAAKGPIAKIRRKVNTGATGKPLNAREKSFSQRDPIVSLNMNLDYLAKSGQRDAATRCEEMLRRIEALHSQGYYDRPPDVVSYNSVINAYALRRAPRKTSRSSEAKRLIKQMEEKGNVAPNVITYNTLLRCILKDVGDRQWQRLLGQKVEEAESILSDMESSRLANTISYNTVISIISKSKLNDSGERAELMLQRMEQNGVQPDTYSFNSVIHAYANTCKNSMRAPNRARRCLALIEQMEELFNSGKNSNVKPDVISYSAVVNAYGLAAAQEEGCATRALEVLARMVELHKGGDEDVKPNKRTYTAVINAFARVGKADTADALLLTMKELTAKGDDTLKPDTACYSSVLDAYAKAGGEEAAFRAEELLHEMQTLYSNGDMGVKPNARTYRSVITALGKSNRSRAGEKAEKILDDMIAVRTTPNTIVYNAVIDAYARSKSVSKAYRAELLLERMMEESEKGNVSIQPDTITFNSVINAAATSVYGDSTARREAYLIGLNAFKTVHGLDYCKPSSITYITFLKLLDNLVESGASRDYMAEKVFGLSSSLGLASGGVRSQLRKTCSPLVARRILYSHGKGDNSGPT